jgi:hypothetical protein
MNFRMEGSMLRAVSRLVLVLGSVALGAAGAVALRADLLVGYGFGKALEARKATLPFELAAAPDRTDRAEVGDEVYWLTRSANDGPAPFDKRLVVGDRITIAGRDGRAQTLEVIDLKLIGAPIVRVAADAAPVRLVRVTARVVGATDSGREELVRFFIEIEERKPAPVHDPLALLGRT